MTGTGLQGGWWLRSPGNNDNNAAFVNGENGNVNDNGNNVKKEFGVRPALKLNLSSVIFSSDTNTFSLKPAHTHSFTYAASGATITATCNGAGNCDLTNKQATLTIAAEGGTYDGTTAYSATVTNNIPAVTGDTVGSVAYYKVDTQGATTGGTAQTGAPTGAGYYYASVTMTSGSNTYTAVKAFTVSKADPTATAPTATATYGQTLANVTLTNPDGNTAGTWAWADATTTSVGTVGDHTFKANFTPTDTTNYNSKSNVDVTVTVGKAANPATVTGTASVIKGGNTVDLSANITKNGATGDVTYAISGSELGCSVNADTGVFTSGDTAGDVTVQVRIAADDNYNALATQSIIVTISDKGTQTISAENVTVTYGDTEKKVSATTNGDGAISYAVKEGSGDYIEVNASTGALTIKAVPADGKAYVIMTAAETATYAQATKEVTVTINKANAVAATVTANNRTYDGTEKPLVTVTGEPTGGTMQYALGTDATTAPTSDWRTSIPTATNVGTYYVWYKAVGDDNHTDSEPACVTVTIASADAGGTSSGEGSLVYNGKAHKLVKGGTVSGGTLKYALGKNASTAPGSGWSEDVPEGTDAGTYYVWYRVDGDANHNSVAPACVTVRIAKAPAPKSLSDGQKAKAKNPVYNGKQQALVSAPALPSGYTKIQYSTDGGKTWRDALPTGKDAGSWSVLVRYVGDKNHADFTNGPVKASIAKAKITIAAQDKKTTRGKALAKLTYKVTGSYVSGDSLGIKLSTTAKAAAKAGKYPISVSWNKNSNYSAALKAGTYTLADAILDSEKKAAKLSMDAGLIVTWDKDGILARWGGADGAQRYEIYAAYCGKKNVCKKAGTVGAGTKSFRLTRLGGSRLNKQRPVKLNVRAYRKVDGEWKAMAVTIMAHVVSPSHKKYTNAAGIALAKDSFQLKTGGTAKIKAKEVLADKRKASILETHDLRFRCASSNEKVAKVSENGTITAVGKGTCTVYVYARNGRDRKAAVTVK